MLCKFSEQMVVPTVEPTAGFLCLLCKHMGMCWLYGWLKSILPMWGFRTNPSLATYNM